jgi:fatty acid/phospholipid biosynthesis enzyme
LFLVGDENAIGHELSSRPRPRNIEVRHASEVVGMDDRRRGDPAKKDSRSAARWTW